MPRQPIPLQFGGMWSAGDPSAIPNGYCRLVRNHLPRPGPRFDCRPPFVYDNLMNVHGLFTWDNLVNQTINFGSLDSTVNLRVKTSGETWGSPVSASGVRMTDYANFLGKVYIMCDDGAGSPSVALSYDGTNVSTSPFTSAIVGRTCTTYKERLYISYPRVTVTPLNTIAVSYGSGWTPANGVIRNITQGATTTLRLYPQSTSLVVDVAAAVNTETLAANATRIVRQDILNNDTVNSLPLTCKVSVTSANPNGGGTSLVLARNTAVTAGQLCQSFSILFRCITTGTTANVAPTFGSAVLGDQITDGTAVWLAERSVILLSNETSIDSWTATAGQWSSRYFPFTVPWSTNGVGYQVDYLLSNSSTPLLSTLSSVDFAYKDGLADGDVRKANKGFQLTAGDFYFPFVNTETAVSSTQNIESVVWTEIDSNVIRAANTFNLKDVAGLPTAAAMIAGRYLVFKRRAFWTFSVTSEADNPIQVEDINKRIGCISPRAVDSIDDTAYFIGEDEVYAYRVGGEAVPLCGDPMREEIMAKGTGWVENQSTYKMPLLAIDQRNREVWIYTQAGKLYCYNLATKWWSTHDVSNSAPVRAMAYNPNTQEMYVSFGGYGLARLDPSQLVNDTIDNTATTYAGTAEMEAKPVENFAPRVDFTAESVGVFHLATAAQSSDVVTLYWSTDRGTTFPNSNPVTLNITNPRNQFAVWRKGPSITFKITKTGRMGATGWAMNKADATLNIHRGEWPASLPTGTGGQNFA